VGAALALLFSPRRRGTGARGFADELESLAGGDAAALFERGQQAIRTRIEQAAREAQETRARTEQRLQAEYRHAKGGG
jgi:hypothetical protein